MICDNCGCPMASHPRTGCAYVDGLLQGPAPYPTRDPWDGTDEESDAGDFQEDGTR